MIKLTDLSNYFDSIKTRVENINNFVLSPAESHVIKRLKDLQGITLVVTYPTASGDGENEDNVKFANTILIWVIYKPEDSSVTPETELADYEKCQNAILEVLSTMNEDRQSGCHLMNRMLDNSVEINPEYNVFGGYNGWTTPIEFGSLGY